MTGDLSPTEALGAEDLTLEDLTPGAQTLDALSHGAAG